MLGPTSNLSAMPASKKGSASHREPVTGATPRNRRRMSGAEERRLSQEESGEGERAKSKKEKEKEKEKEGSKEKEKGNDKEKEEGKDTTGQNKNPAAAAEREGYR